MRRKTFRIWYDEDGDYLEINFKKCKETYFNEVKKDYAEIFDKETNTLIGYAFFNFKKRKGNLNLEINIPKEIFA